MGYREDVALAISVDGWSVFLEKKDKLDPSEIKDIDDLLAVADEHWENPDGDHMFIFESIKTGADDWSSLQSLLRDGLNEDHWRMVSVGEDGAEDTNGNWYDNPFDLGVSHSLSFCSGGCVLTQMDARQQKTSAIKPIVTAPVVMGPPINNHTCTQCGNNACSKTEKSCWKCGAAITK